ATDGIYGTELWQSDGTAAGTRLLREFIPGSQGTAIEIVKGGGRDQFFFVVSDQPEDSTVGVKRLWRSDGSRTGTFEIQSRKLQPIAPSHIFPFGDGVLFNGRSPDGTMRL